MFAQLSQSVHRAMLMTAIGMATACAAGVTQAATLPPVQLSTHNQVPSCVGPGQLMNFLKLRNPRLLRRYDDIARRYAFFGKTLGVRWDVAFLQMMVETGNLTFRRPDGSPADVAPEHNNFAGLGAVGDGRPGETFYSIDDGVRAHLEHVLHYAGRTITNPVAERTRKVQAWRVLENWHRGFERPITFNDLALRWAPHTRAYLDSISQLAVKLQNRYCGGREVIARSGERRPLVAQTAWRQEKPTSQQGQLSGGRWQDLRVAQGGAAKPRRAPPKPAAAGQGSITPRVALVAPRPAVPPRPAARPRRHPDAERSVIRPSEQPEQRRRVRVPKRPSADEQVRLMVSDRKFLLNTEIGTVVPIVFRSNGSMSGNANGLAFFLGSSQDQGKWWVKKGKLCQKWKVWLDRETHCMTLKKRGGTVWWKSDDGKSGTARIVAR